MNLIPFSKIQKTELDLLIDQVKDSLLGCGLVTFVDENAPKVELDQIKREKFPKVLMRMAVLDKSNVYFVTPTLWINLLLCSNYVFFVKDGCVVRCIKARYEWNKWVIGEYIPLESKEFHKLIKD